MKKIILLLACFLISGCANGFTTHYNGLSLENVTKQPNYIGENHITVGKIPSNLNVYQIISQANSESYAYMGYSTWVGPLNEGEEEAREQAKNVGASRVLWGRAYSHTNTGQLPIRTYKPGDVVSTNFYGDINGTAITYFPGQYETQYIPISVDQYRYMALYFYKYDTSSFPLGIITAELSEDWKRMLDNRDAILVFSVIRNSKAFYASIFPGDVIIEINNMKSNLGLGSFRYGKNTLKIYRNGQILTKEMNIENSISIK